MSESPTDGADPPRVLLVADCCSLRMGGEAALPYHMMRVSRARGWPVRLVTHERCREELQELLPEATMHFVRDTRLVRLLYLGSRCVSRRLSYLTFEWGMRRVFDAAVVEHARGLAERGEIDVVHVAMPVSPKDLSTVRKVGRPVVFGPMNGGMTWPPGFRPQGGRLTRAIDRTGRRIADLAHRLLPAKREAALLLAANPRTAAALPAGCRGRVEPMVENGVDLSVWQGTAEPAPAPAPDSSAPEGTQDARFVFVGRLVDWKVVDVLIDAVAAANAQEPSVSLEVIGDGEERPALEAKVAGAGLGDRVAFSGWMSQEEAAKRIRGSAGLVLPSIFECGGAVVLEAMAAGRPAIATAWGGPADYLDETCGVLVSPDDRATLVAGFAAAMRRLADDPDLRDRLGRAGLAKVRAEYDWERKMERLAGFWCEVAAAGS